MNNEMAKERIKSLLHYMESLDADEEEEKDIEALRRVIEALDREETVLKALEEVKAKVEDTYGVTEGRIKRPMIDKYELLDFINQKIKESDT